MTAEVQSRDAQPASALDVREALRLGTRIALLDRGKLEILATPQEFLKSRTPQTRAFLDVLEL